MHTYLSKLDHADVSKSDAGVVNKVNEDRRIDWRTVVVAAVVISYVDGFWVTSLRGAIGAVKVNQNPFRNWVQESTLALPLFFTAVFAALAVTRRWISPHSRERRQLAISMLVCVAFTSAVGLGEVAVHSLRDYRIQSQELAIMHPNNNDPANNDPGNNDPANNDPGNNGHAMDAMVGQSLPIVGAAKHAGTPACTGRCAARRATRNTYVQAAGDIGVLLLVSNLLLFVWVLMLRAGRLWHAAMPTSTKGRSVPTGIHTHDP
jgi:hypothetical protein